MLKLYTRLEEKLTDLESRENIRIYGVSKGMEKDSTGMVLFIEKLLREGFELPDFLQLHESTPLARSVTTSECSALFHSGKVFEL